jgi:hypothetical protein
MNSPLFTWFPVNLTMCACADYQNESKNSGNQVKSGRDLVDKMFFYHIQYNIIFSIIILICKKNSKILCVILML